jgi:hypothetical protein
MRRSRAMTAKILMFPGVRAHDSDPYDPPHQHNEPLRLSVCTDCAMYLANGLPVEGADPSWNYRVIAQLWPVADWDLVLGDEEGDEFSWSECDACGSTLGGSRYSVAALRLPVGGAR